MIRYQEVAPRSFVEGWFTIYREDSPRANPDNDSRFYTLLESRRQDGTEYPIKLMSWCPDGPFFRVRVTDDES